MFRSRIIRSTIVVAIVCSILSSAITVFTLVKLNLLSSENTSNTKSQNITISNASKVENVYQAVAQKATPSVVGITTKSISRDRFFNQPTMQEGVGTGIIVDANGYILTNSHVVSDGQASEVSVLFNDGTSETGKVVWYDSDLDLAIVKADKTGLEPAELGDSDEVTVGDIAIAIGNPLGLEFQKSVTQGIISGLNRSIETEQAQMSNLIQTDASINSGNSGGPLLNSKGQVIGINTAKASEGEAMGFAIPINTAKNIVQEVISKGNYEKVTLGIKGTDVATYEAAMNIDLEAEKGAYVVEVVANSPAEKAGIRNGDTIVKVGDTEIESFSDLSKALYKYSKSEKAVVVVNRGGREVTVNVQF
ncbi:MAG: trypsin-like peptidase domain-containing protein [Clostridioides sp.]|jgi:S1-C subfamily serine protease|nr:trypsin-like peptidase domain-containing protein [Clostridioides sp.]